MFVLKLSRELDTANFVKIVVHFATFLTNSPVQCTCNTQFQIILLNRYKHQCDKIIAQCSSRLLNELIAACIFFVHFCSRMSASHPGI